MKNRGYTLIELLTTLSVISLLLLVAVPAFSTLIDRQQLRSAGQALFLALNTTRATAITRQQRITLWNQDGNWQNNIILFTDDNANGKKDPGETTLRKFDDFRHLRISGNRWVSNYVSYSANGSAVMASGAFQVGTISICKPDVASGYQLVISIGGRVRLQQAIFKECS